MTLEEQYRLILMELRELFGTDEARSISRRLMEHFLGLDSAGFLLHSREQLPDSLIPEIESALWQLKAHKPLQYVTGKTWFMDYEFSVNEHVLIPRPETEEMVQSILDELKRVKESKTTLTILDIGTGSGCIAVALSKSLVNSVVYAIDISEEALNVARENARMNGANVSFLKADILDPSYTWLKGKPDIIVSNPPYVTEQDKVLMQRNVVDYEPHAALFVPADDPLVFYRAIESFAVGNLAPGGRVWLEINEQYGPEVKEIFSKEYFTQTTILNDFLGKNRFVKAIRGSSQRFSFENA